jgi:hypothetical protein
VIRLTVKGLAKFMTRRPAAQRKILRDFKFPQPEGFVQTTYYAEARQAIRDYHAGENDPATLVKAVDLLRAKADRSQGQTRTRLEHNIRAVESYVRHLAGRRFKMLQAPRLEYSHGGVAVRATPDLSVQEKGRESLIKLELGADLPDRKMIKIILQVIYEAGLKSGLRVRPQDVIYLDASRAVQHRGAQTRARLRHDIQAACESIDALWTGIKQL